MKKRKKRKQKQKQEKKIRKLGILCTFAFISLIFLIHSAPPFSIDNANYIVSSQTKWLGNAKETERNAAV